MLVIVLYLKRCFVLFFCMTEMAVAGEVEAM